MTKAIVNGFNLDDDSTLKFKPNPKRAGFKAHARYDIYQDATTLDEYIELSQDSYRMADLRYDEEKGYLEIFDSEANQVNAKEPKEGPAITIKKKRVPFAPTVKEIGELIVFFKEDDSVDISDIMESLDLVEEYEREQDDLILLEQQM